MASEWLKFFGKDGTDLNLAYGSDGVWRGKLYMGTVSCGLVESANVFIIEDVLSGSPGQAWSYPLAADTSGQNLNWRARWKDQEDADFFWFYTIDSSGAVPYIVENQVVDAPLSNTPYFRDMDGRANVPFGQVHSAAMQFNVAFSAKEEYYYDRTFVIEDLSVNPPQLVAEISLHCETEGEDERFAAILENLGRRLAPNDEMIMRDSDIKEDRIDWELLNLKRKELLVAGQEIYPYIGSYRGLVNVLRFFGYQDLRVKEYWLNINQKSENFGKMAAVQVDNVLEDPKAFALNSQFVDSPDFKKTSLFGLYYDLTKDTGETDEFGIPLMTNAFAFTNEEVLVKLYGLKKRLEEDFMPANAKIYDITGEGIYFQRYGMVSWNDQLLTVSAESGLDFDFKAITPVSEYIRDLRRFKIKQFSPGLDLPVDRFTNLVNPYSYGQAYPVHALATLNESIIEWYEQLSNPLPNLDEKWDWSGDDEPGVIAGMPVVLQATIDNFTWDDMEADWDGEAVYGLNWLTVDIATSYEIGWKIEKGGELPYKFYFRGPIRDYAVLPHFLPYAGKYKVTMYVFDLYGGAAVRTKTDYIEAKLREVEIAAVGRWKLRDFYGWDMKDRSWDDLGGSMWIDPAEAATAYNSPSNDWELRWANYRDQNDAEIKISGQYMPLPQATVAGGNNRNNPARRFGTYALRWENMDLPWDEMWHSSWNYADYHGDVLGAFKLFNPQPGDMIGVDDYPWFTFTGTGTITLQDAVDQLRASDNPGIMFFKWHVFEPPGSPGHILATAEEHGAMGWHFISYNASSSPSTTITGEQYTWKFPAWNHYQNEYAALLANLQANWPDQWPFMNPDHLFLDIPLQDFINGAGYSFPYWSDRGFVRKDQDSPYDQSVNSYTRGFIPAWTGSGMFKHDSTRMFKDAFACPLGVPIFFVSEHSEIAGKNNVKWRIVNDLTGEVMIDCRSKYCIYNFLEESEYTVECEMTDCNGNKAKTVRRGFVASMDKQSYLEAVKTGFAGLTADAITATSAQAGMLSFKNL